MNITSALRECLRYWWLVRARCYLALVLLGAGLPVHAIPQLLPTAPPGQPVSRVTGFNNVTTDLIQGLKVPDGAIIDTTPGALNKYAPPTTFTLLASRA